MYLSMYLYRDENSIFRMKLLQLILSIIAVLSCLCVGVSGKGGKGNDVLHGGDDMKPLPPSQHRPIPKRVKRAARPILLPPTSK